jgi:hypothetical protein
MAISIHPDKPSKLSFAAHRSYEPLSREINPFVTAHQEVERLVGESLPETKDCRLFYIRGVGNDKFMGGEDKDLVLFPPNFAYVLDVGFPSLPTIVVPFENSGHGDPRFPDFTKAVVCSTLSWSSRDVLFPAEAGEIIVSAKEGVDAEHLKVTLSDYAQDVQPLAPSSNLFWARVEAFHEAEIARAVTDANLDGIRYAEVNRIVRLIDFAPGWIVDRIA